MKLKIKVTKEILRRSMYCGTRGDIRCINENCAVAEAVRDIFPKAHVTAHGIMPLGKINIFSTLNIDLPQEATELINKFDSKWDCPKKRLDLPELEFTIDVPEALIEHINIDDLERCETMELVSD